MTEPNRYEESYARLDRILGLPLADLELDKIYRLRAEGFMDFVVEALPRCAETGARILSLAHYFRQAGDLCQDPEMTVRIFPPGSTVFAQMVPSTSKEFGRLEALTFQQSIPPISQLIYPAPGRYYPKRREELNDFLATWLLNVEHQGHRLIEVG